jgi:light-regulated signal transduction histidine kinase (bacteriophytochrome)
MQKSFSKKQGDALLSFLEWADAFDEAMALVNEDGEFLVCNLAMAGLFHIDLLTQSEDFSIFDLVEAQAAKRALSSWDCEVLLGGKALTFAASSPFAHVSHSLLWKARPHGTQGDVLITVQDLRADLAPIQDAQLGELGMISRGQSQDDSEAFERVFARVSHDLQAPLRRIRTFGGLIARELEQSDEHEKLAEYMETLLRNATRNAGLVDAMTEYFSFDGSSRPVQQTTLRAVIDEARERADVHVDEVTLEGALDETLYVEQDLLLDVLTELFANTSRFARDAHGKCQVMLRIERALPERQWSISYEDNGPGVSPRDYEVMFEPFERLPPQPPRGQRGFGVGLALCRKRMSLMRGHICARTSPQDHMVIDLCFVEQPL